MHGYANKKHSILINKATKSPEYSTFFKTNLASERKVDTDEVPTSVIPVGIK